MPVQPQPMQQPTQQPQFFNNAPMPGQMAYAQPPKKSKKGLIIGLIVGGVVLLAAIAGVVIWLMMSTVSKADYQKAADAYTELKTVADDMSTTSTSATSISSIDTDNMSTKVDTFETKLKSMKDLKAMNDSEVKAAYDKLTDPVTKKIAAMRATITFLKASKDCGTSSYISKSSVDTCTAALKSAKGQWTELNTFIDALVAYYQSTSSGSSSSAYTNLSDASKAINTTTNKYTTDVTDALNALKDVIDKKLTK